MTTKTNIRCKRCDKNLKKGDYILALRVERITNPRHWLGGFVSKEIGHYVACKNCIRKILKSEVKE